MKPRRDRKHKDEFLDLYKQFEVNYRKLLKLLDNGEPMFEWIPK